MPSKDYIIRLKSTNEAKVEQSRVFEIDVIGTIAGAGNGKYDVSKSIFDQFVFTIKAGESVTA